MADEQEHPARLVASKSRAAVTSKNREAWLALFADDALIQDPIGKSPVDPEGNGISGKAAIEKFWDRNVAPNSYEFEIHHSYAAGNEVANHMTLHMVLGNGMRGEVTGVFTYALNDSGKICNLKGYWQLEDFFKTMRQADEGKNA